MKSLAGLLIAASCVWAADSTEDRAAIDEVIASRNAAEPRQDDAKVWSEVSRPLIVTRSVQFLSSSVARVDASRVRYGSLEIRSVPLVIMLHRTRAGWSIISVREGRETLQPPLTPQPVRVLPQ